MKPVGVGVAPNDMAGTPNAGDNPVGAPKAGTVCWPKAVEVPNVGVASPPDDAELPNVLGDPKADVPEAAPKLPNDGSAPLLFDACGCPKVGTGVVTVLPKVGVATVALTPPALAPNLNSGEVACSPVVVVADLLGIVLVAPKTGALC